MDEGSGERLLHQSGGRRLDFLAPAADAGQGVEFRVSLGGEHGWPRRRRSERRGASASASCIHISRNPSVTLRSRDNGSVGHRREYPMMMSSSHRVVSVDSTKRSFVHPLLVRIEIRTTRTSSPLRNRQVIPHHRINLPPYADVRFCVTGRASALVIRSPYFFG